MGYIMSLIRIIPLVIILGSVGFLFLYLIINKFFKKKFESKIQIASLYMINLYAVVVIYATFLSVNHPLMGSDYSINLIPFDWVYTTYTMGISNGIKQFILNIILFIPLGVLLPMSYRKFDDFKKVLGIGVISVLLIETSQLIIGRIFDIDDIIANTLGSIAGYCFFSIIRDMLSRITKKDNFKLTLAKRLSYIGVVLIIALIPIGFEVKDRLSEYGSVPVYGFNINDSVNISVKLDDNKGNEKIYRVVKKKSEQEVLRELSKKFNITTASIESGNFGNVAIRDENFSLMVEKNLCWAYSNFKVKEVEEVISQEKAISIANSELIRQGYNLSDFKTINSGIDDMNNIEITYVIKDVATSRKYGSLMVRINGSGEIRDINSYLVNIEEDNLVNTISKKDAIKKAKKFKMSPDDYFGGKTSNININRIENDYVFENRKGHIQPAYKISGTAVVDGKTKEFELLIPSMK